MEGGEGGGDVQGAECDANADLHHEGVKQMSSFLVYLHFKLEQITSCLKGRYNVKSVTIYYTSDIQ